MKNRRESGTAAKSDKNSDTGQPGYLNRLRGSFFPGGSLFQHRLSGGRELPQAGSPLTGGVFFAEIQRWGFAVCGRRGRCGARRGDDAVPTAVGKKEGTPAVSLPL